MSSLANVQFDPGQIRALLKRYAPVRLDADLGALHPHDREALGALQEAATWIDPIYWRQVSEDGLTLREQLRRSSRPEDRQLERLLVLNAGPWDMLDDNRPFCASPPRPPGANFYPRDLTRGELDAYLECHPEEKDALLKPNTLVRRQGGKLIAVPYREAYREELEKVSSALIEASHRATSVPLGSYLEDRSRDLLGESLYESDCEWVRLRPTTIDIAIGPFDYYDDDLMGLKTSYEATVLVRHPLSDRIDDFKGVHHELSRHFGTGETGLSATVVNIGVFDVVFCSGAMNVGSKAIAATLPNDERVLEEVGSRLLIYQNVITAKFHHILRPLGTTLLARGQQDALQEEAFVYHTLFHEMAHALGERWVHTADRRGHLSIHEALKERYTTLEECRADLVGLLYLDLLVKDGMLPAELAEAALVTFLASSLRAVRFGLSSDHARAAGMILTCLIDSRALHIEWGGRVRLEVRQAMSTVSDLAERIQMISSEGDYEGAGQILASLSVLKPEISTLLTRVRDIPTDLEFVF